VFSTDKQGKPNGILIDLWVGLSTIPAFKGKTLVGDSEVLKITLRSYCIRTLPPIKVKEDMNGKSIIIMRGYSYGGWIKHIKDPANNVKYLESDSHDSAFRMLKAGRADYLFDYKSPATKALENLQVPGLEYNDLSTFSAYFVVSAKARNAAKLLHEIESSYKQLIADGAL